MKYYAVLKGETPGIYFNWDDCKKQVSGFSGAEYGALPERKTGKAAEFRNDQPEQ